METKHTKGEWSFQTPNNKIEIFSSVGGMAETDILNSCLMNGEDISTSEQIANAKLIASAPDLLDALILAKELIKIEGYGDDYLTVQKINSAIKKAIL